jgi:predicted nucleic acid-binding protein
VIVVDSMVMSHNLEGRQAAKDTLTQFSKSELATSSMVVYEQIWGALKGNRNIAPKIVQSQITADFDVLDVTIDVAREAAAIKNELRGEGLHPGHRDAVIAATARVHGGKLLTEDSALTKPAAKKHLDVVEYDP